MKRRAVRLISAWLLQRDFPDWAEAAIYAELFDRDMGSWQSFLVVTQHPDGGATGVTWCSTIGVYFATAIRFELLGLKYFSVPVADILDLELAIQVDEYLVEPEWFDADHPAPVDIVDCETL